MNHLLTKGTHVKLFGLQHAPQLNGKIGTVRLGCRESFAVTSLVLCAKCRMVDYCSKECQMKH